MLCQPFWRGVSGGAHMKRWMTLTLTGALLAAACGGDTSVDPSVSASKHIPTDGPQSWVSYAHQVSVVRVVAESQIGPDEAALTRGEGLVGRSVTLQVETTVWAAPGSEPVQGEIEMHDWGWLLKDGELRPFTNSRLEVGGRYLVPLADFGDGWGSMELAAIPIEGDAIATGWADNVEDNPWLRELAGSSLDAVGNELATTEPDPVAARFSHLPPIQRYEAVQEVALRAYQTAEAGP